MVARVEREKDIPAMVTVQRTAKIIKVTVPFTVLFMFPVSVHVSSSCHGHGHTVTMTAFPTPPVMVTKAQALRQRIGQTFLPLAQIPVQGQLPGRFF